MKDNIQELINNIIYDLEEIKESIKINDRYLETIKSYIRGIETNNKTINSLKNNIEDNIDLIEDERL